MSEKGEGGVQEAGVRSSGVRISEFQEFSRLV